MSRYIDAEWLKAVFEIKPKRGEAKGGYLIPIPFIYECIEKAPSIEIDRPQGEVDAIDRDALIDYCLKLIDVERKQGTDVMNYGQERVNQTEVIINYIEHMPHVNTDRPQGEWILKYEGSYLQRRMYCSACGKRSGIGGIESNQRKPFCPNCGARMKGADDEVLRQL